MIESMVANKEAKKVEEEQNKEKEEGLVPLQAVESDGVLYDFWFENMRNVTT